MSRNFLLLTTTIILSMVAPSHTAKPYCSATNNLDVFPHDVIPLQSSPPVELPPDTLDCEASTISNDTRNTSSVLGATAESSLPVARDASITLTNCLALIVFFTLMLGILAFTFKLYITIEKFFLQWAQMEPARYDIEWRRPRNRSERATKAIWDRIARIDRGKGPCIKQMVMTSFEELQPKSKFWRIFLAYTTPSICVLLNEAFDELKKHPEIYQDPKLYDFATVFLMTLINRVIFMEIRSDKKVAWLKKCYISKTR
ncbi:hypothetical protein KSP39_PZI008726 [Platanthera zijinensis]|uniref:Uncharacterized protein n=1 Tax=Platanthera zijinensis TaxID=2320716 RepID=A0AAP0G7U1_9ASPA